MNLWSVSVISRISWVWSVLQFLYRYFNVYSKLFRKTGLIHWNSQNYIMYHLLFSRQPSTGFLMITGNILNLQCSLSMQWQLYVLTQNKLVEAEQADNLEDYKGPPCASTGGVHPPVFHLQTFGIVYTVFQPSGPMNLSHLSPHSYLWARHDNAAQNFMAILAASPYWACKCCQ